MSHPSLGQNHPFGTKMLSPRGQTRRTRYQLIFIFKLYKSITKVDFDTFFTLVKEKKTRGHSLALLPKFAKNNFRLKFFTVSAIALWNKLSQDDVNAPNLSILKLRLHTFFVKHDIW